MTTLGGQRARTVRDEESAVGMTPFFKNPPERGQATPAGRQVKGTFMVCRRQLGTTLGEENSRRAGIGKAIALVGGRRGGRRRHFLHVVVLVGLVEGLAGGSYVAVTWWKIGEYLARHGAIGEA